MTSGTLSVVRELHPRADPDGILRDGDIRGRYFQTLVTGGRDDPRLVLGLLFNLFNLQFWNGKLPRPSLVVVKDFEVGGRLVWESQPMVMLVHEEVLLGSYEGARDMILHEMCHLYVRGILEDRRPIAHSGAWIKEAERLGVYISEEERAESQYEVR